MADWVPGVIWALFFALAFFLLPIRVGFSLLYAPNDLDLRLYIGTVRPILISIPIPLALIIRRWSRSKKQPGEDNPQNQDGSLKSDSKDRKQSRGSGQGMFKFARAFLSAVRSIDTLEWHTKVGTGDAATTSYAMGGLWTAKAVLVAWLRTRYNFVTPPTYSAAPDYDTAGVALKIRCIFRFTIGEIIVALAMKSLPHGLRGVRIFGPKPTSH